MLRVIMRKIILSLLILMFLVSCKKEQQEENKYENPKFELLIPDTLKVGKTFGKVNKYSGIQKRDDVLLTVIVDNEYENNEIRKDTFSDGTLSPFFTIIRNQKGKHQVNFIIEEKILNETTISKDSSVLKITTINHYYSFEFIVSDKNYKSDLNNRLFTELELKYKE
jgi:hypothetical protein